MSRLHLFDLDGTLLTGSTASLEVARVLGTTDDIVALEAGFAGGRLDTRGFAVAIRELWHALTPALVADAFAASPWLTGIREVCADIRGRGEFSAVITMSPDFFARHLLDLGFDDVVASGFPPPPFDRPIDPATILTPADKVRIAEELRARHGLPLSACVAFGDSMSDAPLFRHLRHTVAVNADHHLRNLAALRYEGEDLWQAYTLSRGLAAASTPPATDRR